MSTVDNIKAKHSISESKKAEYITRRKPNITIYPQQYCSHGCWYCISEAGRFKDAISVTDIMGTDNFVAAILSITKGHSCEFRLSGGEPLEHPHTDVIIRALLNAGHDVCIGSNLTNISKITHVLDETGKKVRYEASFHLGQYLVEGSHKRADTFVNEILPKALKYASEMELVIPLPPLMLNHALTPYYLDKAAACIDSFGFNHKDVFNLTELGGTFYGRNFPAEYTSEERVLIENLHKKYGKADFDIKEVESEATINRSMKLTGLPCFNMSRLFQITTEGDIHVCGGGAPYIILGNIREYNIADKINIIDDPLPCEFEACVCPYLGLLGSLQPHGLNFTEYLKLRK